MATWYKGGQKLFLMEAMGAADGPEEIDRNRFITGMSRRGSAPAKQEQDNGKTEK